MCSVVPCSDHIQSLSHSSGPKSSIICDEGRAGRRFCHRITPSKVGRRVPFDGGHHLLSLVSVITEDVVRSWYHLRRFITQ